MKILVIQLRRIGDMVLATPALEALRRARPEAELHVLAEPPCDQVLEGHPCADRVLRYEPHRALAWLAKLRKERYDWAVDFLGNPRSAALTLATLAARRAGPDRLDRRWAYNVRFPRPSAPLYSAEEKMRALGVLGVEPLEKARPSVAVGEARRARAREALAALGPGPWNALAPGSRRRTRRWPAASFGALAQRIAERGPRSVVVWGPGERALAEEVVRASAGAAVLAPETPHLLDLAALLEACVSAVANCNGPRHLAVAAGTPTLALHFSSDPRAWNPPDEPRFPFVRAEELACIGCRLNDCPYDLECMRLLTPERAWEAYRRLPVGQGGRA